MLESHSESSASLLLLCMVCGWVWGGSEGMLNSTCCAGVDAVGGCWKMVYVLTLVHEHWNMYIYM